MNVKTLNAKRTSPNCLLSVKSMPGLLFAVGLCVRALKQVPAATPMKRCRAACRKERWTRSFWWLKPHLGPPRKAAECQHPVFFGAEREGRSVCLWSHVHIRSADILYVSGVSPYSMNEGDVQHAGDVGACFQKDTSDHSSDHSM